MTVKSARDGKVKKHSRVHFPQHTAVHGGPVYDPGKFKSKATLRNVVAAANEARSSAPSIPPGPWLHDTVNSNIPMARVPPALRDNAAEAARRAVLRGDDVVSGGKPRNRTLRKKRRRRGKSRRRSRRHKSMKRRRARR